MSKIRDFGALGSRRGRGEVMTRVAWYGAGADGRHGLTGRRRTADPRLGTRYARDLAAALRALPDVDAARARRARAGAGRRRCGSRSALPLAARGADVAARAERLPAAAPAVPGRGDDPRPRLRGVSRRTSSPRTRAKFRWAGAARRPVGGAGDVRQRVHARRRLRALRRRPGEGRRRGAQRAVAGDRRRARARRASPTCSASATCAARRTGCGSRRRGGPGCATTTGS